ncbi:MAG: alpha/beta hydrolase [Bacillota bacterium]|nr:alpha/beta hydrolase [Bacillota bacterium]MDW7684868.1 alpha/beta hydrolase [Bacillota bacterium]
MAGYARFYLEERGYNVLLPDNRGHGESQGHYIGFGRHDRLDCLQWVDEIISRNGEDSVIVLHGVSMGGATVLMVKSCLPM